MDLDILWTYSVEVNRVITVLSSGLQVVLTTRVTRRSALPPQVHSRRLQQRLAHQEVAHRCELLQTHIQAPWTREETVTEEGRLVLNHLKGQQATPKLRYVQCAWIVPFTTFDTRFLS